MMLDNLTLVLLRRKGRKDEHVDSGNWGFRTKPVGQDNIPMHQLMEGKCSSSGCHTVN